MTKARVSPSLRPAPAASTKSTAAWNAADIANSRATLKCDSVSTNTVDSQRLRQISRRFQVDHPPSSFIAEPVSTKAGEGSMQAHSVIGAFVIFVLGGLVGHVLTLPAIVKADAAAD